MKIHHLNCGTLCPICAQLLNGTGGFFARGELVCHCLLVESEDGLVLIDTGIGQHDIDHPRRLGAFFDLLSGPVYKPQETAIAQVKALGFQPSDVRHIIPTHLDLDHAGGLADFPHAKVHVHKRELDAALSRKNKQRYIPRQLAHDVQWESYEDAGEDWFGFEAIHALRGLPPEFLMIPTFGHSQGHCSVALKRGEDWLLHCGDAYFHRAQIYPERGKVPFGIKLFESSVQWKKSMRIENAKRLQHLAHTHQDDVTLICAHDPVDFQGCLPTIETATE